MTDLHSELTWLVDDYISLSDVIESDRGLPPNTATRERAKAILFMTDWQPIATAPKDGTVIDLWLRWKDGFGKRIPDGFWQSGQVPLFFDSNRVEGWVAANCGYDGCDGFADDPEDGDIVTHWMPLPDPPKD